MRHGEKTANHHNKIRDCGLTAEGIIQSIQSGRKLDDLHEGSFSENAGATVVSPYKRTIQTAILSLSQTNFSQSAPPTIFLEPLIGERYKVENGQHDPYIMGTNTDALMEYIFNGNLETYIHKALEESGQFSSQSALIEAKQKASTLIRAISTENMPQSTQNWWPTGSNVEETIQEARARLQIANTKSYGEYSDDKPRFYVTHAAVVYAPLSNFFLNRKSVPFAGMHRAEFQDDKITVKSHKLNL